MDNTTVVMSVLLWIAVFAVHALVQFHNREIGRLYKQTDLLRQMIDIIRDEQVTQRSEASDEQA